MMWCHTGYVWCHIFGLYAFDHRWNIGGKHYHFTYTRNVGQEWMCDYVHHRDDGPAIITHQLSNNTLYGWYQYGKLHRDDGPAYYDKNKTFETWYYHGKKHRKHGPAYSRWCPPISDIGISYDVYVKHEYCKNGYLHRLDGPSTIWSDGIEDYHIMGMYIDERFIVWMKERNMDLTNLSEEDKMIIYLEWPEISEIIRLTLR